MSVPLPVRPARRRGACPSLAAPMATGDGLLVRLPLVEPMGPAAARALAMAAAAFGNGGLEISARGNLQLRGCSAATLPPLRAALAAAGIAARLGRAVETNPLPGLDPGAVDPRPLAAALRSRVPDPVAARLAAKVSVVVDGGGRFHLAALAADVRLDAFPGGWRIAVAGDAVSARPLGTARDVEHAAEAAARLLAAIAARGPETRAPDLDDAELAHALAGRAPGPTGLPRRLAARGTAASDLGHALDGIASPEPARALAPGGAAARPPLGVVDLGAAHVLALAFAFGATDAATFARLAEAAAAAGGFALAPAPGRTLLVAVPDRAAAVRLEAAAAALGIIVDPADPRLAVVACAGRPACASAHIATRPLAARVASRLPRGSAAVHVSGCEKRCANPGHAAAELIGRPGVPAIAGEPALAALLAEAWAEAATPGAGSAP